MEEKKESTMEYVEKFLKEKYKAFIIDESKSIVKIYKINDKEILKAIMSESEKKDNINIGEVIIITLQSEDNINLTSFKIQGQSKKLYNELLSMIGDSELNYEMKKFKLYGPYMQD